MREPSYDLKVLDVVQETSDTVSILLEVPEGLEEEFSYRPGQFLTVAVPSEETGLVARAYSLSSSPEQGGPLSFAVKRSPQGYASHWLCDHVHAGDTLRVLAPSGIFTPADFDADLLLVAAGSGVTPVISIARHALAVGTGQVVIFDANYDRGSIIFAEELARLEAAHPDRLHVEYWLETERGLPTQEAIAAFAAAYTSYDAFVCGPPAFMKVAVGALRGLGIPRHQRHQEKFVSLGGNPFED